MTPVAARVNSAKNPLRYTGGSRRSGTRRHFDKWRADQQPPIPQRCDNEQCRFHTERLIWNGKPLSLILDHRNGVNTDDNPTNLQLLCPNCDSQNRATPGGANRGRVRNSAGGFCLTEPGAPAAHILPIEPGHFEATGQPLQASGPGGQGALRTPGRVLRDST
jgi:hypothetical protein